MAQELRAAGAQVSFIGGERAEAQLVPAAGFALERIQVEGLSRSNPLRALRAVALAVVAVPRSLMLLRRLRPDAVMGGGGYVAGPVGFAAVCLRIPLVLTEADSHLGLTNRLLARFARRVCLAFAIPGRDGSRYKVTGRPVAPLNTDRQAARVRFGLTADETCVLVFGGSLGARSINIAAIEALAAPDAAVRVLHISGRRDYAELAGRELPAGYELRSIWTSRTSLRRSLRATWWWPARVDRCSRSPRTGFRRSSCLTRTRRATIRRPTPAGWPMRVPRS